MTRIAVVEDNDACAKQLQAYISRYSEEKEIEIEITRFENGAALLEGYRPYFDLLLLDIEMPQIDGMTAAHEIRRLDAEVVIIFVTNMAQYAINGYEVGALDFVLKPVSYVALSVKLDKAVSYIRGHEEHEIFLNLSSGVKRLGTRHIYYVEVQNHRLFFHTDEGRYTISGSMKSAEEQLQGRHFVKCNSCYLVNLRYVSDIRGDLTLVAGQELQISRRSKKAFQLALTNYVGRKGI